MRERRPPPPFRRAEVARVEPVTPRLMRVTLAGPELDGFEVAEPAASVRLLLPWPGEALVLPRWDGNEFLLPDGRRPAIRTFTPLPATDDGALDIAVVLHGAGVASRWAATVEPGAPVALSGPGRGYTVEHDAPAYVVAGDESALPAITQVLDGLPEAMPVEAHVEIGDPDARLDRHDITWHERPRGAPPGEAVVAAVRAAAIPPGTRLWVAGEAAAVQRVRRHLFEERGVPREHASVRGYWKQGRAETG